MINSEPTHILDFFLYDSPYFTQYNSPRYTVAKWSKAHDNFSGLCKLTWCWRGVFCERQSNHNAMASYIDGSWAVPMSTVVPMSAIV